MYKHTQRVGIGAEGGQFVNVKGYLWMKDRERGG